MRETQERCPSPLKSIVFETFLRFQKLGSVVKILFWHAEYRGICLGFLYGSEWSVGVADCHSQCAHWLRNDTVNKGCSTNLGGRTEASTPTEAFKGCVGEGLCPSRRAGKSAKRRRWRMQRAGFEEVPRLADTTVAGNRLARRWATAGPYEISSFGIFSGEKFLRQGDSVISRLFSSGLPSTMGETKEGIA